MLSLTANIRLYHAIHGMLDTAQLILFHSAWLQTTAAKTVTGELTRMQGGHRLNHVPFFQHAQ